MGKRWSTKPFDPQVAQSLADGLGVLPLTARVLAARGYTDTVSASRFLSPRITELPDPALIPGMEQAAKRVADGITSGEKIWIYTDFDADGVTSAALLATFLESLEVEWEAWLPRRDREGYGLHIAPLEEIARRGGGLVLTADCGITAVDPALAAKRLGLGLVITDHHMPIEELPDADAVVNPKIAGSAYPDQMIAGVGVAWNLCAATRRELRARGWFGKVAEPDVRSLLDFVAIGTVADVVPLRNVNRIFVAAGLERLNRELRPGIGALASVAGLRGELGAGHLGFQIGPRINAAGRMEGPQEALLLLMSQDYEAAKGAAAKLDALNVERRSEEAATLKLAMEIVEKRGYFPGNFSLVIEGEGYHQGVIGIVASRLADRFYRPVVVLTVNGDTAKGSARSIPGLDLYSVLDEISDLFVRFGGHAAAAGMTLKTSLIPEFRARFEEAVKKRVRPEDLIPEVTADAHATEEDLTFAQASELERLSPFGYGNPTPVVMAKNLRVRKRSAMGRDGEHLKLEIDCGLGKVEVMGWSMGGSMGFAEPGTDIDVIGSLRLRQWKSSAYPQLVMEDARPASKKP